MQKENKKYWKAYHKNNHPIFAFTKEELKKARDLLKKAEYTLVYDYYKEEKENKPEIWEEDKPKRYKIKIPSKKEEISGLRKFYREKDTIFIYTPHLTKNKDFKLIKKIWLFDEANELIIKQQ